MQVFTQIDQPNVFETLIAFARAYLSICRLMGLCACARVYDVLQFCQKF